MLSKALSLSGTLVCYQPGFSTIPVSIDLLQGRGGSFTRKLSDQLLTLC